MGTFLLWFQGDTFNVVQHDRDHNGFHDDGHRQRRAPPESGCFRIIKRPPCQPRLTSLSPPRASAYLSGYLGASETPNWARWNARRQSTLRADFGIGCAASRRMESRSPLLPN